MSTEITVDEFFREELLLKLEQVYEEAKLIAESPEDILRVKYVYDLRKSQIELDTSRVIINVDENKKPQVSLIVKVIK